jgi:hypothetical protein
MDILNYKIVLMDYLYNYEYSDHDIEDKYWNIKNDIYIKTILSDKVLEKKDLKDIENKIESFYKLYYKFNFIDVFDHPNPILYITYLSHVKEKLFTAKKRVPQ